LAAVSITVCNECLRKTHWFGQQEMVVFGLYPQVLENGVGPEALHEILTAISIRLARRLSSIYPVIYLPVPDGIVDAIASTASCGKSLVPDEEVQVLGTSLA